MKSKLLFVSILLTLSLQVHAQNIVSADSDIQWTNVSATSYQASMHDLGGNLVALNDPATNDPDGDGVIDIPSDPSGTTTINLSVWLIGRSLGVYTFHVRSVDSAGNEGAYADLVITYAAPAPPVPTVVLNYEERSPFMNPARRYLLA